MWRHITLCVVLGGCGFHANPANGDDAPIIDAAVDAVTDIARPDTGDGPMPEPGCFQNWFNGPLMLTMPEELTELSTGTDDRDPWISQDGKRLYFAREPGAKGMSDIYTASRAAATGPFGTPGEMVNLDTTMQESRPSLTADELTLVLATNRDSGDFTIRMNKRPPGNGFGTPDLNHLQSVNGTGNQRLDPFLSPDGARLYFAPDTGPSGKQEIRVSTRNPATSDYGMPMDVGGINGSSTDTADPALARDERLILYSRRQGKDPYDLYYATRGTATDAFHTPARIPNVNGDKDDADPVLSDDGCELYFSSNRDADGKYHLFRAQVMR